MRIGKADHAASAVNGNAKPDIRHSGTGRCITWCRTSRGGKKRSMDVRRDREPGTGKTWVPGQVSVITPCFNGEKYIGETIESVLAQDHTDWEMIVIDDGSTDRTEEIVRRYMEREPRIRLVLQDNRGSAAARNHGIRLAGGQYIALLDADDLWDKRFLSEQIRFMKMKKASCVFSSYRRINEHSEEILRPVMARESVTGKDMMRRNHIGCLTGLYDISEHGKIYLHEELKSIRDDYAYWIDVLALTGVAYGNPEVLASYRVSTASVTGNKLGLVRNQYRFYRVYLKQGITAGVVHTLWWAAAGLAGRTRRLHWSRREGKFEWVRS